MQKTRSGVERSFAVELNRLRKRRVDKLFRENLEEVSGRIVCKMPNSRGSENLKRLVRSAYVHVCQKAGQEFLPAVAIKALAVLDRLVVEAKSD